MTPRLHRVGVHNDHSGMPDHYVYQCRVCERLYTHHALLDDHTCASDAQPATFEAELAAAEADIAAARVARTDSDGFRITDIVEIG